jgi:NitT/TauT family transport system permease protein
MMNAAPREEGFFSRYMAWFTTPGIILIFILIWEFYVKASGISKFVLPSPSDIGKAIVFLLQQDYFIANFWITVTSILTGFAIAIVFGTVVGVALGKSRLAERLANPFVIGSQVTPKVALMPLFLLWLGFGVESKIAIVALLSFFPVLKNTILGVRSIEKGHKDLFVVIRAGPWKRVWSLEVPAVMPYVLTGIETASVLAVTGAIVGEYLGGSKGMGAMIVASLNSLQTDQMFATIIVLTVFGFAFYSAISVIRRFAVPWHGSANLSDV